MPLSGGEGPQCSVGLKMKRVILGGGRRGIEFQDRLCTIYSLFVLQNLPSGCISFVQRDTQLSIKLHKFKFHSGMPMFADLQWAGSGANEENEVREQQEGPVLCGGQCSGGGSPSE